MEAPRITIYYRMLSNIDGTPITEYMPFKGTNYDILNYGHINPDKGGESPYIIEFDIWNNEPAFSGGMLPDRVSDAINCSFEVWDNSSLTTANNLVKDGNMFVYVRCVTKDKEGDWIPIAGVYSSLNRNHIVGNANINNLGVLSGQPGGDHTVIQTKLKIPPAVNYNKQFNFVINFEYDY